MYRNQMLVMGLFSFLMLLPLVPTSQAELWELIILLDMEESEIQAGESVWVTGKVVDHAYKPVAGANILLKIGTYAETRYANSEGEFRAEFSKFQEMPGKYTVNVLATEGDRMGRSNIQFDVKGESTRVTILQEILATDEARNYLSSKEGDFEKNPIGQKLFKYYHGLLNDLIKEQWEMAKPDPEQILVEEQRTISENLRDQDVTEFNPRAGIYEGYSLDRYISNLDSKVRNLIESQLNFTKNNFLDAQNIRDDILANGGTYAEARQAYLDRLTVSIEDLEQFNKEHADETKFAEKNTTDDSKDEQ